VDARVTFVRRREGNSDEIGSRWQPGDVRHSRAAISMAGWSGGGEMTRCNIQERLLGEGHEEYTIHSYLTLILKIIAGKSLTSIDIVPTAMAGG